MDYIIVFVLVIFSALFSGLTLGFFSLNKDDLKRKAKLGDERAKKVYEIRKDGNLLLCTLLIGNVAVNSALSIFLGSITSGFAAGLIATSLIVIFGEIVPQSVFSRYALEFGSRLTFLVKVFRGFLLPICWPIAKILDKILGDEISTVYSKHELMKIIEDHEDSDKSELDDMEERIIKGALSFSEKTVEEIMTPRTAVYFLSCDRNLSNKTISEISNTGHSRIPVYKDNKDNILGILYVKDLIKGNWEKKKVEDICRKDVIFAGTDKKLDDLLNDFKKTRHHLFMVINEFGGVSGIVTIEDVIEEIIGEEIIDEFDKHEDMQQLARNNMKKKKINKV